MKARKTTNIRKIYTSEWELKDKDIDIYFFLKKTYTTAGKLLQCNNIYIDINTSNQSKGERNHTYSIEQHKDYWNVDKAFVDSANTMTWVRLKTFNTYREVRNYIVTTVKNNFIMEEHFK